MGNKVSAKRLAKAKEAFRLPAGKLEPCDLSEAPFVPKGMTRAFKNNRYVVMIYDNTLTDKGFGIQCLIQKHDNSPILNHWKEIQQIKNDIFGKEVCAIEYYPKESKLLDTHNIYWIWVFPDGTIPEYNPM